MQEFWRRWVHDPRHLPVDWTNHPHLAFKVVARLGFVSIGSTVPVGLILIQSGVLDRLDEGSAQVGLVFWATGIVFLASWLGWVVVCTALEEKALWKHLFIGSLGPGNTALVALLLQRIS